MFRLHSTFLKPADAALDAGVLELVRAASGSFQAIKTDVEAGAASSADCLVRIRNDHRGLWVFVAGPHVQVHLNGRPICRLAMIRGGDVLFVDGCEFVVQGRAAENANEGRALSAAALRAHGGGRHGISIPIRNELLIGSAVSSMDVGEVGSTCTVRLRKELEYVSFNTDDLHADIALNGEPATRGVMVPGDQLTIGSTQRFVLEGASRGLADVSKPTGAGRVQAPEHLPVDQKRGAREMPWLLLAAVFSALLIGSLLMFGAA